MKKIAAMLLLVLLAAGCAKTPAQTAKTEQMPQDFAICFAWWYNLEQKNSMDTATGKLQKDCWLTEPHLRNFSRMRNCCSSFTSW